MNFTKAETDENFPLLRLESEGKKWEIGLSPVLYGVRVRAGQVGSMSVNIDYCAGADRIFQLELLATVVEILKNVPEDITPHELEKMMPGYTIRPIDKDPCWTKLKQMAYGPKV